MSRREPPMPPTNCHPREGGDPVNDAAAEGVTTGKIALSAIETYANGNVSALPCTGGGYWVPAFAGMTVGGFAVALQTENPAPCRPGRSAAE